MVDAGIREATIEDAAYVALNLRDADRAEIWASGKNIPIPCLLKAYRRSEKCRVFEVDGEVVCIFGVVPLSLMGSLATPWMLGTDKITENWISFLRESRNAVLDVCSAYDTLINYVDKRNTMSIRWLQWVGFNLFEEPEPHGPFDMPFHRFELRK